MGAEKPHKVGEAKGDDDGTSDMTTFDSTSVQQTFTQVLSSSKGEK